MIYIIFTTACDVNIVSTGFGGGVLTDRAYLIWEILQLLHINGRYLQSTRYKRFVKMDPQPTKEQQIKQQTKPEHQEDSKDKSDKKYIRSNKKWKDFHIDENIIDALRQQNKTRPTRVQEAALEIALDSSRKKFNLLLRAINGSGKTLAFLLPMILALEPGLKTAEDKVARGKTMQNQIFRPQGIIIIQNFLLQSQLNDYLENFRDYGENNNVQKLKFKVGVLNTTGHTFGDIIVCMLSSFLNRHARGNMKLDQCKFVAIDQIDQIYNFDKDGLAKALKIFKDERPNIIACSATMQKHFLSFYQDCDKDYIKLNLNQQLEKQTGEKITLEGVKNYYKSVQCQKGSKNELFDFILKDLFKHLYAINIDDKKPQVFIFFNSVDDIYAFDKKFEALASDFTTDQSKYLQHLTRATIASKVYKDGKKVQLPHEEKRMIITKFRNGQTKILMCTNIMARGIDIRNAVFVINIGAPKTSDKENDVDVDIYLHRVGRTGRYNDKGVALTVSTPEQIERLTTSVKKVHKIEIRKMQSQKQISDEVYACIKANGS